MASNRCHNSLSSVTRELIFIKIKVLDFSLFQDEQSEKVDVAGYFLSCVRMFEPWWVLTEIKLVDGFNIWIEKGFENELTNVLISVIKITEKLHVEDFDWRIVLYDLSE